MRISLTVFTSLVVLACASEPPQRSIPEVATSPLPPTVAAVTAAIQESDDFQLYRESFVEVTTDLVATGRCTLAEVKDLGGWVKSQNERTKPVYFVYCGGMTLSNKIYMDAETGKLR